MTLNRYTPMPRSEPLKRRARAKPGEAERKAWGQSFTACMCCCRTRVELTTHEIAPRSRTEECFDVCNLLRLCVECHGVLQGSDPALQAAFKLLEDSEHFDLAGLNRLRQRAGDSIQRHEVNLWRDVIQAIRGR